MSDTRDSAGPPGQPNGPLSTGHSHLTSRRRRGRPPHPDILTPREWEVLALIRERLTNRQIAERLGLTIHAARYHVSQIISRLGVATREQAAGWTAEPEPTPAASRRQWWQRLRAPLTLAKAVGVGASFAAVAGLAVLAWGVLRTSGNDDATAGDDDAAALDYAPLEATPDATPFVYATDVWVVDADGSNLKRLTNLGKPTLSGYDIAPAWSPDGTRIAFFGGSGSDIENGYLYVMRADGTNVTELAPASFDYTRTSWCESDRSPVWSPDGKRLAYQSNNQISVVSPDTGETPGTLPGNSFANSFDPAWSTDSKTLAYSTGTFQCFMEAYSLEGESAPRLASIPAQDVSWSPDGKHLAYVDAGTIMVADADGRNGMQVAEVNLRGDALQPWNLQWSPDGTRVSYMFHEPDIYHTWIYIADLTSQGSSTRLEASHRIYDWSPDGRTIVYQVQEDDSCHYPDVIYTINSDGSGEPRRIVRGSSPSWSPDGRKIAFIQTTQPDVCPTPIVIVD